MRLFPSFRRRVKAGRVNLTGPFDAYLMAPGYEFSASHEVFDDIKAQVVGGEKRLEGAWEGGGEDDRGNPLPETYHAEPAVWPEADLAAVGVVLCRGEVLVGYEAFPVVKHASGGEFRLTWPDGTLTLG